MTDRTPYSEEVELALVARLLVDPTQIPLVAADLHPEDLYVGVYRKAYQAMLVASQAGKTVDKATLGDVADAVDIRSLNGGFHAPLTEYVAIVRRDAMRRRVIDQLDRVVAVAYETEDIQGILADLQDAVAQITKGAEQGNLITPQQVADLYAEVMKKRAAGQATGLPYGIKPLDDLLHPAQGGEMVVVAARPSVGKTALAEHVAYTWATHGVWPVLFCSLEMSLTQLMDRAVARRAHIPTHNVVRARMTADQLILATETVNEQRSVNIWYLDDPMATTASIRTAAAKVRLVSGGIEAIIVDYLQLVKDAGDTEVGRVTRMSRNIKAIAREFDVPLLCLSQLNRGVMAREDQHPQLHDLRESGAIEQDADVVIGLYRPLDSRDMDVEVLKARQGRIGRVGIYFDPEYVGFSEDEHEQA